MSRILIIDNETALAELLKDELKGRGHEVLIAENGAEGIALAKRQPDLILLDIMMPGTDGFAVCRAVRDQVLCPIIFLSARQSEIDKVRALTIGGDDYVTKPFGLQELIARIEANLRRERRSQYLNEAHKRSKLWFGELSIDLRERSVTIKDAAVPLAKREYDIVELLALHAGQIFSKEHIYESVWGCDAEGDSATVVEHIRKIRKKLEEASPRTEYLSTVWGIGYKWNRR